MRATRVAALSPFLGAAFLAFLAGRPADAQIVTPVDVDAALERVAHGGWHPMPTDPEWLAVKSAFDWELAASPRGELASKVRQAAVRIEVGVSPLVSHDPRTASFSIDTRPWISTAVPLPYFVELYASMDGGEWTLVAAADSGAGCDARVVDVAWPAPVSLDFHHVRLLADVYHLARPASASAPRCGIRRRQTPGATAAPARSSDSGSLPTREPSALSYERRSLPGLSFGLLDTSHQTPSPSGAARSVAQPEYSVFIRQAQQVPASVIDQSLPSMPFERWLFSVVDDVLRDAGAGEFWTPPDFCNADEGRIYRAETSTSSGEVWRSATELRRTPRAICASVLVPIATGVLTVRLRVGTLVEDTAAWLCEKPSFYEAFVGGGTHDLDIPSLAALAHLARLRPDEWPRPDIGVTLSPASSPSEAVVSGLPVRLNIRIQNIGARTARFVHGTLDGGCGRRPDQQFAVLASVAAGEVVTIERPIAPTGASICAGIVLFVGAPPGLGGGMRTDGGEAFQDDNAAIFLYGPAPP